jgi:hypothetical protein
LRELEKNTSKDHADYDQLTKAMATVHSTISAINKDIHINESRLKVTQVDSNPNPNPGQGVYAFFVSDQWRRFDFTSTRRHCLQTSEKDSKQREDTLFGPMRRQDFKPKIFFLDQYETVFFSDLMRRLYLL